MQTFILTLQENIFDVHHLVDVHHKRSGYARLGKMGFQRSVRAAKKSFRLLPCPENIIVHREVAFNAARLRFSPVLFKEKSVR